MLGRFTDYIQQQHLFPEGEEVLLAVSGGRDSVCMAHLFHRAGIPFSIAHCNFHLRPGDCDRDEAFVRHLAESYGVSCHVSQFDTRAVAASTGESIEEAARRLRYEYFLSLIIQRSTLTSVATAHHRDDSIETFFLNLFRGTGIAGLHGIRPISELRVKHPEEELSTLKKKDVVAKNEKLRVIRPLLCFNRAEIDAYVAENHLEYVEDNTNSELEARRNQIRHRLMPLLRELYPSIDDTMAANIERLYGTELIYKKHIEDLRSSLITHHSSLVPNLPFQILSLDLLSLRSQFSVFNFQFSMLFEFLHPYNFNASTVSDILAVKENGKLFFSPTHVAELHRGKLLVAPNVPPVAGRHPQSGDRIRLKKGTRLLSDYLKDRGFSRIERQHLLLHVDTDGFVVFNS